MLVEIEIAEDLGCRWLLRSMKSEAMINCTNIMYHQRSASRNTCTRCRLRTCSSRIAEPRFLTSGTTPNCQTQSGRTHRIANALDREGEDTFRTFQHSKWGMHVRRVWSIPSQCVMDLRCMGWLRRSTFCLPSWVSGIRTADRDICTGRECLPRSTMVCPGIRMVASAPRTGHKCSGRECRARPSYLGVVRVWEAFIIPQCYKWSRRHRKHLSVFLCWQCQSRGSYKTSGCTSIHNKSGPILHFYSL